MLNDATCFKKVYLALGYTDLRRGIDGLAITIQHDYGLDPGEKGVLFLFCGRRSDRIKGLLLEGDGFLLLYKRLERDSKFQWPRNCDEMKMITEEQYGWLMRGLSIYPSVNEVYQPPRYTL